MGQKNTSPHQCEEKPPRNEVENEFIPIKLSKPDVGLRVNSTGELKLFRYPTLPEDHEDKYFLKMYKTITPTAIGCARNFNGSEDIVVCGGSNGDLNFYSIDRSSYGVKLKKSFQKHSNVIASFGVISDTYFAVCSYDKNISIWNLRKMEFVRMITGHSSYVFCCLRISDDHIATAGFGGEIIIFNWKTGTKIKKVFHEQSWVSGLVVYKHYLVSVGNQVQYWNMEQDFAQCKEKDRLIYVNYEGRPYEKDKIFIGKLIPRTSHLIIGDRDHISIFDLETEKFIVRLKGKYGRVCAMSINTHFGYFMAGSDDGMCRVFRLEDYTSVCEIKHKKGVWYNHMTTNGEIVISGESEYLCISKPFPRLIPVVPIKKILKYSDCVVFTQFSSKEI